MSACITIVPTSSFAKNYEKLSHFSAHFFKTFSNSYICFSLITLFYVRTVKRNSCRVDSFPTNISSCRNGSHTDLHTSSIQIYLITLKNGNSIFSFTYSFKKQHNSRFLLSNSWRIRVFWQYVQVLDSFELLLCHWLIQSRAHSTIGYWSHMLSVSSQ